MHGVIQSEGAMWLRIGGETKPDSAHSSSSSLTVQIWLMC